MRYMVPRGRAVPDRLRREFSVSTLDHVYVGRVGAVEADRIEVLARGGEVWWLTGESIYTVDEGKVTLVCDFSGIPRYRVTAAAE